MVRPYFHTYWYKPRELLSRNVSYHLFCPASLIHLQEVPGLCYCYIYNRPRYIILLKEQQRRWGTSKITNSQYKRPGEVIIFLDSVTDSVYDTTISLHVMRVDDLNS